jgi:hypothetical protein
MCMSDYIRGFGLMIGFTGLFDTARDYMLQFTITHTGTSVHSDVFTISCSVVATTADVPLPLCSRTLPGLSHGS